MNLRTLNLLGICFVLTVLASLFPAASFAIQPPPDAGHAPGSTEFSTPAFRVSPALEIYEVGSTRAYSLGAVPDFFAGYSERWEVRWDVRSDRPHLIQGVGIPLLPGRGNDLRREELGLSQARDLGLRDVEGLLHGFMAEQSGLLGISQIDLRLDPERSLVYGANDYLWLMEFQQFHEGVPVERAKVFFRVNHGNIIQFGTSHVADVEIDTTPTVNRLRALRSGLKAVGASRPSWMVDRGSLKIYPTMGDDEKPAEAYLGANGMGYQHRLVWEFVFRLEGDDHAYKLVVDAHSGKVLEYLDLARFATVQGDVYPVTNTDPLETVGFPYCSVSNSGTKITDADGNYTYSGGTATVQLNGRYTSISDNCGSISLSDSTDGNIDFGGSTGTDCTTPGYGGSGNTHSARTGFYHLTNINRKAATYLPSNTWLDSTLTANMNINDTCNAYWSGSSGDVNFYRSGGGCSNTGEIAAVFLHEWGHGLDDNTGGSASDQGSGEALGDTFAFLELREACIGENFQPGSPCHNCNSYCTGVRDLAAFATGGISTIARPDTVTDNSGINCDRWTCPYYSGSWPYQGPMGYEGHCESYIAGSANWDLAQLLVAEHGTEPGWAAMNDIWYGSITPAQEAYQVTSGGTCNPSASVDGCASDNWYTVYLSVDDDDGNLANGTPNGCRIWDAFDAHGIACGTRPACSGGCTPQPIVDAGTDQTICLGDSTTIGTAAQPDHSYSWSPGGYTVAQPTVSPTTTTTYTVTATTTCGSAGDSVIVTVDAGGGGGLDDDFEGGLGSWSTSGLWHLVSNSSCASPGYASAVNAVYYGQDSSCDYATGSATTGDLISPE
ncbi:MAG: hypothetical protein GY856_04115, partial [bacterium]|nr:hypothetical protein [bacterium]